MTFQAYEKGLQTVFKAEERCRQAQGAARGEEPPGGLLGRLWLPGFLLHSSGLATMYP